MPGLGDTDHGQILLSFHCRLENLDTKCPIEIGGLSANYLIAIGNFMR